jgi:hypothetical protein
VICQEPGCDEHYGCRLKNKGINLSPQINKTATRNWRPRKDEPPGVNAQILYDKRPDGSMMPVMNPNGTVVRHKQAVEQRHKIADTMARIRAQNVDPAH